MDSNYNFERIQDFNMDDVAIKIERTPEFLQAAQLLSDFIRGLPIDQPTNDRLVAMMVDQVQQAEKGAFVQGLRMGKQYSSWEQDQMQSGLLS